MESLEIELIKFYKGKVKLNGKLFSTIAPSIVDGSSNKLVIFGAFNSKDNSKIAIGEFNTENFTIKKNRLIEITNNHSYKSYAGDGIIPTSAKFYKKNIQVLASTFKKNNSILSYKIKPAIFNIDTTNWNCSFRPHPIEKLIGTYNICGSSSFFDNDIESQLFSISRSFKQVNKSKIPRTSIYLYNKSVIRKIVLQDVENLGLNRPKLIDFENEKLLFVSCRTLDDQYVQKVYKYKSGVRLQLKIRQGDKTIYNYNKNFFYANPFKIDKHFYTFLNIDRLGEKGFFLGRIFINE